jgi:hypothetical protein
MPNADDLGNMIILNEKSRILNRIKNKSHRFDGFFLRPTRADYVTFFIKFFSIDFSLVNTSLPYSQ